jgi:hypothetical protein
VRIAKMVSNSNAASAREPGIPGGAGQTVQEDLELSGMESHDGYGQTRTNAEPEIVTGDDDKKTGTDTDTGLSTILHGPRLGLVVAAVCLGSLMISLDVTIIATVLLPPLVSHARPSSLSYIKEFTYHIVGPMLEE